MDYIQSSNKQADKFGPGAHGFSAGDPDNGFPATFFTPTWSDTVQQELINVVKAAGVVPTAAVLTQVAQAVKRIAGGNVTTVNAANSPFVLTADHAGLVIMDGNAGNCSVTLPAANVLPGLRFTFARTDATNNTATINCAGADALVNGGVLFRLVGAGDFRGLAGDGASLWATISKATDATSLPNLVDNSNFTVCQRQLTSPVVLAAGAFGHDRFKAGAGGCTYTFATVGANVVLTVTAGTLIHTVAEEDVEGGVYRFKHEGAAQTRIGVGGAAPAGAYSSGVKLNTGVNANQRIAVEFGVGTIDRVQWKASPLESTYAPPKLADTLFRCEYFLPSGAFELNDAVGAGYVSITPTNFNVAVKFRRTARTKPTTFLVSSLGHFTTNTTPGGGLVSAISFGGAGKTGANMTFTAPSASSGFGTYAQTNNAAAFMLFPGAEI